MVKNISIRIDSDVLKKFKYVCAYEGRSANSQMNQLVLRFIAYYEKKHGQIEDAEDAGDAS